MDRITTIPFRISKGPLIYLKINSLRIKLTFSCWVLIKALIFYIILTYNKKWLTLKCLISRLKWFEITCHGGIETALKKRKKKRNSFKGRIWVHFFYYKSCEQIGKYFHNNSVQIKSFLFLVVSFLYVDFEFYSFYPTDKELNNKSRIAQFLV